MKQNVLLLFMALLLVCLTGCSKEDAADPQPPQDAEVNVAAFDRGGASIDNMLAPMLMGDSLYFWRGDWDKESERWSNTVICRRAGGEGDTVEIAVLGDRELLCFTVDEGQGLYYLYADYSGEGKNVFFRKDAADGSMVYNVPLPAESGDQILYDVEQNGRFSQGAVNSLGETVFRSSSGSLYLFGSNGEFLCAGGDGWDAEQYQGAGKGIVNCGDDGIYTYAAAEGRVLLSEVNMADAGLGEVMELAVVTEAAIDVFSGYGKGLLISDGAGLWQCAPDGKERERLFGWGDVGLKNYDIDSIGILEDGRLYMVVMRKGGQDRELAYIETMGAADVPGKRTVVIGIFHAITGDGEEPKIAEMAEEFNHYSKQYQVEIKYYDTPQDMYMELLKGEGPDGFQLFHGSTLASKGVLEDLSPYFAGSTVVRESDLLPSVREAGSRDGKLLYLFPEYSVKGHIVKQGAVGDGEWTPEEYLGLGLGHPEALLYGALSSYMIMESALYADMGSFLDWQGRECSFDSERFISILESVRQVTDGKQLPDAREFLENACQWLHDGKVMTHYFQVSSVYDYMMYKDAYGDFAEFVGYPNSRGETYYRFVPRYMLAMNSASENKDGVWAFLEYLLSEDYQGSLQTFSVRKDTFEGQIEGQREEWDNLSRNYQPGSTVNPRSMEPLQEYPELEEGDVEELVYLVYNAYWDETFEDIMSIISEETGSFWSGDKTAEAVADIIQNRVQLYLEE